jgi:mRNA interferase MazF
MGMVIKQYEIHLINLDPTIGHEIKKVRPCAVISPDEMNKYIETVIIAPMTSQGLVYPTRVPVRFKGKDGWVVLDQIRTVDKRRLIKKLGRLDHDTVQNVKAVIQEMLVD